MKKGFYLTHNTTFHNGIDSQGSQSTHTHAQARKGVFPRKAPKPQPRDPERRTVQNEEYEQASSGSDDKSEGERRAGRARYVQVSFSVHRFLCGGMG